VYVRSNIEVFIQCWVHMSETSANLHLLDLYMVSSLYKSSVGIF